MKKNYFLSALVAVLMMLNVNGLFAQALSTTIELSTAENPIWYNLNSAATVNSNAAIRALPDVPSPIQGDKPVAPEVVLPDQGKDKYLWRFEGDNTDGFVIINKLTGQQITNPAETVVNAKFFMSDEGSKFTFTGVEGIQGQSGVTGTAFYFSPVDDAVEAVGRLNSQGTLTDLVLFRPSGGGVGDISNSGGRGSMFWLRKVDLKTVSVEVNLPTAGEVSILKDDGTTPEAELTVSKATNVNVSMNAVPATGYKFVAWKNKADNTILSTETSFVYNGTTDITIVAEFVRDSGTGLDELSSNIKLSPKKGQLEVVNSSSKVVQIHIFAIDGRLVTNRSLANGSIAVTLQPGIYIVKNSLSGKAEKVIVK